MYDIYYGYGDGDLVAAMRDAADFVIRRGGRTMFGVRYCGTDGDLVAALRDAADFVAKLRDDKLLGIIVHGDETAGWTVQVICRP